LLGNALVAMTQSISQSDGFRLERAGLGKIDVRCGMDEH